MSDYPTRSRDRQRPLKAPKRERRAEPSIYVEVPPLHFVKAHVRKRGNYRYLAWREAGTVREWYMGRIKNGSPTPASSAPDLAPTRSRRPRRARKGK